MAAENSKRRRISFSCFIGLKIFTKLTQSMQGVVQTLKRTGSELRDCMDELRRRHRTSFQVRSEDKLIPLHGAEEEGRERATYKSSGGLVAFNWPSMGF